MAETNDLNPYIGVDFLETFRVVKVLIQGRYDADMWVETFKIVYTTANGTKEVYTNKDGVSVSFTSALTTYQGYIRLARDSHSL